MVKGACAYCGRSRWCRKVGGKLGRRRKLPIVKTFNTAALSRRKELTPWRILQHLRPGFHFPVTIGSIRFEEAVRCQRDYALAAQSGLVLFSG